MSYVNAPVHDLLIRIKNAYMARKTNLSWITYSKFKTNVLDLLKRYNFVKDFEIVDKNGKKEIKVASEKQAEAQIKRAEKVGATILTWKDADYPFLLRQIKDAPPVIFVLGHMGLLGGDSGAIVGTRNASLNGKNIARPLGIA